MTTSQQPGSEVAVKPSQSIRSKLLRSSLAVLAVSQLGLLAAMIWIITSLSVRHRDNAVADIRSDLMEKGRTLMANHSLVLPRMAEDNAFNAVAELVSTTVDRNPDIVYGIYMDSRRQPWAIVDSAHPTGRVPQAEVLSDSACLWAADLSKPGHLKLDRNGEEILEFAAPIRVEGERAGTIRYGLSTARMHGAILQAARLSRQALLRTLASVLLLGLLSALLAFLVSRRFATRLTLPIQGLQRLANSIAGGNYHLEVDLSGTDEIALLAADFDVMRRRVKEYTERLHEMVEEKVLEIRDILDNIGQGLFTVAYDGRVNPDYASTTNSLLEVEDVARCGIKELFRLDDAGWKEWSEWLELARLRQGRIPWTQIARLCPVRELKIGGNTGTRYIQIAFQPMLDRQGKPSKLMVLVQDVTESRRIEALIRSEKEKHEEEVRAILGIVNNAALVPEFLRDVEARRERLLSTCRKWRLEQARPDDVAAVLRDLHTLKGSASTYGFIALERAARQAELAAVGLREAAELRPEGAGRLLTILEGELVPAVEAAKGMVRRLTGLGNDHLVPIPERKLRELHALADALPEGANLTRNRLEGLLAACRSLENVRLSIPGGRYQSMLSRLAVRLGKAVEFQVSPEDMEISPRTLAALDEPLVHVFRNSLDHGLETREERVAAGKREVGRIELSLETEGEALVVRIDDDGKGIDTDKVAEKAVAMGVARPERIAAMTEAEKAGLILLPGLTTRESSDDLSGLGVGMDAVAAWAASLGGSVGITTRKGQGTSISIRLPKGFEDGI